MVDVGVWLRDLGMEQYVEMFAANHIDGDVLAELSDADLQTLGISLGHRKKLLRAIAALAQESSVESSPAAASSMASSPERRHMTVMFCDLAGSTSLARRLDPEDLRVVLRTYQVACAAAVSRFDGFVAKYLGDGILAYFGYPHAHEDDAERAVRSALGILRAVEAMDNGLGEPVQVRVGIATGLVVVGDTVGDGPSQEQAVVGETPNVAARLQAVAPPNSIVIARSTRDLLGRQFRYESLGPQDLRGIPEPVLAFRVIGEQAVETRFSATHQERLTRLVGRDQEIALLLERWHRAVSGEGQVVLLCGEAGIGKSRVAAALVGQLPRDEIHLIQYQCSPYHLSSPLHPAIQQLELAAGFGSEDGPEEKLAKLARLSDGGPSSWEARQLLAMLLSIPTTGLHPPLRLTPAEQKQRTIQLLAVMFGRLARKRPTLLVLEDGHWIDPTTRELMDVLIEQTAELPALVLITHRPEFQAPWASYPHATVLTLNRLGRSTCQLLVSDLARGRPVPSEVFEQILARTDGVPLFVEELTKTVLESDLLEEDKGRYVVKGALDSLAIPSTLKDSLMARLDRLKGTKEIAQTGAAIGREFSYPLMEAVAPLKGRQLHDALEVLRDSEIVFRRGVPPDATYVFKHALIQDIAYDSMLRTRRQEIHQRIAAALEARFPSLVESEPEVLAHHLTRAGAFHQAALMWLKAGQRAVARSANQEAIRHLEAGLETLGRLPRDADVDSVELDLQVSLGSAWIAMRGYSANETERAYTRARSLLERMDDDARRCFVLHGLSMVYANRADHRRVIELGQEVLAWGERVQDRLSMLVGHRVIAVALNFLGRFKEARQHAEHAARLYDSREHADTASRFGHDMGVGAWWHLAIACVFLGCESGARRAVEQAAALVRQLDNATTSLYSALWDAFTHLVAGQVEDAAKIADEMIEQASRRSMVLWTAYGRQLRGSALVAMGRHEMGLQEMRLGAAEAEQLSNTMLKLMVLRFEAEALAGLGRWQEGLAVADEASRYIEATDERWWEPEVLRIRGEILAAIAGSAEPGRASLHRALAVARQQGSALFEARATASLAGEAPTERA